VTTLAIEINDAGIVVADRDDVLAVEPGFALVDRGRITVGVEAARQARLRPRSVSNRYWSELSLDPSSTALEGVRSSAELAYAQLTALWERWKSRSDEVVLVVPAHYRGAELGLLLGLAQEAEIPVRAMVDVGVAASVRPYPGRQLLYVDASLHRLSVVGLEQGDEVAARSEHDLPGTGLAELTDTFTKRLAEVFVLSTRFDPLHRAETEQLLHDRLGDWLELLRRQDAAELTLPHGGEEFAVEVRREQLLGVAGGFYRALLQLIAQAREPGSGLVVQLSDRLAQLPGLLDELARLDDAEVIVLPLGHAARAVLGSLDRIPPRGGEVKLLRHLPWREAADLGSTPEAPRRQRNGVAAPITPTHVVYRGVARRVDGAGLVVGRVQSDDRRTIVIDDQHGGVSRSHCEIRLRDGELRLRDVSSYGTFVNEKRISGETTLRAADVIRIGSPGAELHVVTVEAADGA
jgi:hypothetical protein